MDTGTRTARAGGCLIAFCVIAGVVLGAYLHQPSIGFLAGLGAGVALSILIWLADRLGRQPRADK